MYKLSVKSLMKIFLEIIIYYLVKFYFCNTIPIFWHTLLA